MKDKKDQIIAAALRIFLKKGYLQATTQEIAKEAEVAEMTLFRKFSTKQNLFLSVFLPIIAHQFDSKLMQFAKEENTSDFFRKILQDRLETLSRNDQVIRLLIAESVMNHLDERINIPETIMNSLKQAIEVHFSKKQKTVDVDRCARLIGGILLSHVILPEKVPYYKLPKSKKNELLEQYVQTLCQFIS
ncbi:MAG TPA: TetR/AcrR family transcriptional regulator [Bacillus bacterium]|nr:TetR/AcrR family transcriptional regulator [Bacillus sp. (in: firmicutes)]